jgi:hypothetical protein
VFFVLEPIHVTLDTQRTVGSHGVAEHGGLRSAGRRWGSGGSSTDTTLDRQQLKNLPHRLSMLLPGLQAMTTDIPASMC